MPFTIDYGPISTAMGLAQQAGQAQAAQTGFSDQMQLQQHLLASQQQAASQRAQEISLALEGQRNQSTNQLAQAQLKSQQQYQQAYLGSLNNYRTGMVDVRQQTANTGEQKANQQGQYQTGELGIQQQKVQSQQAYQQWEQSHGDTIASNQQAQSMDGQIKNLMAQGFTLDSPQVAPLWQQLQQLDAQMKQGPRGQGGQPNIPQQAIPPTVPLGQSQTGADQAAGAQVQPGSRGQIDPQTTQAFIQMAGGDVVKARQMAQAAGWSF